MDDFNFFFPTQYYTRKSGRQFLQNSQKNELTNKHTNEQTVVLFFKEEDFH